MKKAQILGIPADFIPIITGISVLFIFYLIFSILGGEGIKGNIEIEDQAHFTKYIYYNTYLKSLLNRNVVVEGKNFKLADVITIVYDEIGKPSVPTRYVTVCGESLAEDQSKHKSPYCEALLQFAKDNLKRGEQIAAGYFEVKLGWLHEGKSIYHIDMRNVRLLLYSPKNKFFEVKFYFDINPPAGVLE